jgi:hypothetical protein
MVWWILMKIADLLGGEAHKNVTVQGGWWSGSFSAI